MDAALSIDLAVGAQTYDLVNGPFDLLQQ